MTSNFKNISGDELLNTHGGHCQPDEGQSIGYYIGYIGTTVLMWLGAE